MPVFKKMLMCVHTSVHTYAYVCMQVWRPETCVGCLPQSLLYFLRQGLSLNLEFARLSGQEAPDFLLSPPPSVGMMGLHQTQSPKSSVSTLLSQLPAFKNLLSLVSSQHLFLSSLTYTFILLSPPNIDLRIYLYIFLQF